MGTGSVGPISLDVPGWGSVWERMENLLSCQICDGRSDVWSRGRKGTRGGEAGDYLGTRCGRAETRWIAEWGQRVLCRRRRPSGLLEALAGCVSGIPCRPRPAGGQRLGNGILKLDCPAQESRPTNRRGGFGEQPTRGTGGRGGLAWERKMAKSPGKGLVPWH